MKKRLLLMASCCIVLVMLLAACAVTPDGQLVAPVAAADSFEPREIIVLAGGGQDTDVINGFFPSVVHIRVGDTVTWQINTDEPQAAMFLSGGPPPPAILPIAGGGPTDVMLNPDFIMPTRGPDAPIETYRGSGFVSSGFMSRGALGPPNETFSVVFDTPGTYSYSGLSPLFQGTVIVEPATTADVPSQDDIDAMAEAELAPLLAQLEPLRASAAEPRTEAGPNGSTFWHVPAGVVGADVRVSIFDFVPKNLTVKEGDTVIWTSLSFHGVGFNPAGPYPDAFATIPQENGPPIITVEPLAVVPVRPSAQFDGTELFGSGYLGGGPLGGGPQPGGTTFTMTFTKAGTYEYVCPVHQVLGMNGTVTVVAR